MFPCTKYVGKNGSIEHCKGNKTVPQTVATTHTQNGHRQNIKTSTAIQTERKKDQGRDGGTNFIWRIKEQSNTPKPSLTS
jgi:hypothetical protein